MRCFVLALSLLLYLPLISQSPVSLDSREAIIKAYQQKDYAAAERLYTEKSGNDISAEAILLTAASVYQLGKKRGVKKMIDHAFIIDPVGSVDYYDEDEIFNQLKATKFNQWFEARLNEAVLSPELASTGKYVFVYSSKSEQYVFPDVIYQSYIDSARSLMKRGNYNTAHSMYIRAFRISERSGLSLTRAAACAFKAGKEGWADSHIDAAFRRYPHAVITRLRLNDEFAPLLQDDHFTSWVGKHITRQFPGLNNVLIAEMDDIWEDFTLHRGFSAGSRLTEAEGTSFMKRNSGTVQEFYYSPATGGNKAERSKTDRLCARRLTNIFEECGVPGIDQIGDRIVQLEAMLKVGNIEDWEQWKPLILTAIKKGEISGYAYAKAYDEALARSGREQIFGTYMYATVSVNRASLLKYWPIENLNGVDDRRREIGLYSIKKSRDASEVVWPPEAKVTEAHVSSWDKQLPRQYNVFMQFRQ